MGDDDRQRKVYRPLGARMVSGVAGSVIVALIAFLWVMLPADVRAEFGWFERGTLLLVFAVIIIVLYGVFRTRVTASERGLSVMNGYHRHDFDWPELVAISLTSHRPWAIVDLSDGSTVAVMALQTSDGPRATRSAREISAMIATRSATDQDD